MLIDIIFWVGGIIYSAHESKKKDLDIICARMHIVCFYCVKQIKIIKMDT